MSNYKQEKKKNRLMSIKGDKWYNHTFFWTIFMDGKDVTAQAVEKIVQ